MDVSHQALPVVASLTPFSIVGVLGVSLHLAPCADNNDLDAKYLRGKCRDGEFTMMPGSACASRERERLRNMNVGLFRASKRE